MNDTYRTAAQDIESAKAPFTQDQWRQYYTPQQMTGGERVQIFNQLPQAPVLTHNLGTTLLTNSYKFNGVPSIKEVKSDTTTIGSDSGGGSNISKVAAGTSFTQTGSRRTFKSRRRKAKRRSASRKTSIQKSAGKEKKTSVLRRVKKTGKMPPALAKYWANKRKSGGKK